MTLRVWGVRRAVIQPVLRTAGAAALLLGCTGEALPDPRVAAQAYADAAQRGDDAAIYGMLSKEAQATYGREGTKKLVKDAKAELAQSGKSLASPSTQIEARATVRFTDGEDAVLAIEDGDFRVTAALALPSGARTPAQALGELRAALARRSYAALMQVLSAETRAAVERDLAALVQGLEHPDSLDIRVDGDKASVTLPGGHSVSLEREEGVWRVEDFR
ncbi:MAG: hypothetical protein H6718_13260 [Polyangiaceae bacterium]|nr:hypothetical protein [Polyangiaceae bacterium]MCB9607041.1 hypothetical protein [Polyangiaceae bacterium]